MGNCMEACTPRGPKEEEVGGGGAIVTTSSEKEGGGICRVKMLLTRKELEWLVLQLGQQNGEKRLEDLMAEMAKRGTGSTDREDAADHRGVWKPSLESIVEAPEAQSF